MNKPAFSPILKRPASEIKRPPPLPIGHYLWAVQGLPRFDKSSKKGTDFVEFNCKLLQPLDDVDPADLEAAGGIGDRTKTLTFYLTEKSAYRLTEFMRDDLGIDGEGKSVEQMIDETPGRQFLAAIIHEPSRDGKGIYDNIGATAPVES